MFLKAIHDGGFPIRDVRWSTPSTASTPAQFRNKSGVVQQAWIDPPQNASNTFLIAFPTEEGTPEADRVPGLALQANVRVRIRGVAHLANVGFYGWSRGKQIAIGDGTRQRLSTNSGWDSEGLVGYMFGHEVGHNMHQAAANNPGWSGARAFHVPPGMAWSDHPFGYINHGHVGGHCSFGMTAANRARSNYNSVPAAERGTCLMYGAIRDPAGSVGYCEHCQKFLKGYDMRSVQLPAG
jgi:hypothetical protein